MPLNLTEYEYFFFIRQRFCGLEYAEHVFAAGALPRIPWGAHDAPTDPLIGWGGATPPRPHPFDRSGLLP